MKIWVGKRIIGRDSVYLKQKLVAIVGGAKSIQKQKQTYPVQIESLANGDTVRYGTRTYPLFCGNQTGLSEVTILIFIFLLLICLLSW